MNRMKNIIRLSIACIAFMFSLQLHAGSQLLPKIPAAKDGATKCIIDDTDDMRKNHMEYLLHQRDKTVHEGYREKQFSLTGCIDCHNPKRKDGTYARVDGAEHFCSSCHTYASVSIDCFQCHSDRPEGDGSQHKFSSQPKLKNNIVQLNKEIIQLIDSTGK